MRGTRSFTATLAVTASLVAACATGSSPHPPAGQRVPVMNTAATTSPVAAIATDQACTSRAASGSVLQAVPYRADDLAAMTLPKSLLPRAVGAYQTEWGGYGFTDNVEIWQMMLAPRGACAINRTSGRITGFSRAYWGTQTVDTSTHLFFTSAGAAAWLKAYVAGMKALVGSKGVISVRVASVPSLGPGAVQVTDRCNDGCVTTRVFFLRGPLIGSVRDSHAYGAASVIDVRAVAQRLSVRMANRTAAVTARAQDPVDTVMSLSAGLPKSSLGTRYQGLAWDWMFGGCWDVAEAATQTASAAEASAYRSAAARYGQLSYCRAMYSPPRGNTLNGVERVFTGGTLYATATGAHGALLRALSDAKAKAGRTVAGTSYGAVVRFNPGALGDEAIGFRQRTGTTYVTRALIRHGRYVEIAALNSRYFTGMIADVSRWARLLDRRVVALLTTRTV